MTNNTVKGLTVITNDKFKKTLPTRCTVNIDNNKLAFDNFVVVAYDSTSESLKLVNAADPLTLGQAMMMIHTAFEAAMEALTNEERHMVMEALQC